MRSKWKVGENIFIQSSNYRGQKSWYIGKIVNIDGKNNIKVQYNKLGNVFTQTFEVNDTRIRPFIKVPTRYLDPLTAKIMRNPVYMVKSGMVYDNYTVGYLQKLLNNTIMIDPINGLPISNGKGLKPLVMKNSKLKKTINTFVKMHPIAENYFNNWDAVDNISLWENAWDTLESKFDLSKQQQQIFGKNQPIFYPPDDTNSTGNDICSNELRWNFEQPFVYHNHIPFITFTGPSRIGKSFLLNEILRYQNNWNKSVFPVSASPDQPETKGAWITLYNDSNNQANNDGIILIDQWPMDYINMWETSVLLMWIKSLNAVFSEKYTTFMTYIENSQINGTTVDCINNISFLLEEMNMEKKHAESFLKILKKRKENKMYTIDNTDIDQLYLIDMEGLSHGVTYFTKKLFQGCYAIS
eukprot:166661_1